MSNKSGFIWNSIGSIVYSFFNAIVLIFCTRLNGTEIAGIFSICYATGCILNAIGDFGIRIFQVTDINRKYKYGDYFIARMIAVLLMVICAVIFSIVSGYSNEKLYICLILIGVRVIDNFSETCQSEFQIQGRLDIAGKVLLLRNVVEIGVFAVVDIITHNSYISFGTMLLSSIVTFALLDCNVLIRRFDVKISGHNMENVKQIIKECTPLAISTLVSMYVINAVKYAIDMYGNNTMQTYFNVLYMPTFVINLISILIVKSFLKNLGDYWNKGEHGKFIKMIAGIIVFLSISTVVIDALAVTIGIPILGGLYHLELSPYRLDLFWLIISGLFYAASTVVFYALGTIRKQVFSTVAFGISSIVALVISNYMVSQHGMSGATWSCVIIMFTLFASITTFFAIGYKREKDRKNFLLEK